MIYGTRSSRARTGQSGAFPSSGHSSSARQLTKAAPAVTSPAIRTPMTLRHRRWRSLRTRSRRYGRLSRAATGALARTERDVLRA